MTTSFRPHRLALAVAAAFGVVGSAQAQIVVNDTLTGNKSTYAWTIPVPSVGSNGACLTAGDSTTGTGTTTNTIPACIGLAAYSGTTLIDGGVAGKLSAGLPDPIGYGALRLTNGDTTTNGSNGNNQKGAVVSTNGFSTSSGVQISWTSRTYGGNGYDAGYGPNGADGITFFLADASLPASVGGNGGSLGYSCSNGNPVYDGVQGAYVAVGADEYGNFVNSGDNTSTGIGFNPGRIGVRGAGNTNWAQLSTDPVYKNFLTGADPATAIHDACSNGYVRNWTSSNQNDPSSTSIAPNGTSSVALNNYKYLTSAALPIDPGTITSTNTTGTPYKIANQEGISNALRSNATPIAYQLTISAGGILDLYYSVGGGSSIHSLVGVDIKALNNGLALPANVRFGFTAGTGGGSNVHEITCFKAAPKQQSNSSAGSNVQQGARVNGGSQIYLAYYYPDTWYSSLKAVYLDGATAVASSTVNWDANCMLTGGTCAATGATTTADYTKRVILSWSGTAGEAFEYSGGLTNSQITALNTRNSGDPTYTSQRINWLRGDRSNESGGGGVLRARVGVLGDIVDSSPTWVGPPQSPYTTAFVDALYPSTTQPEGTTYAAFAGTGTGGQAGRMNVVYVGANDGMVHGFRAGTYSGTTFDSSTNDGAEVIAYMPGEVASMIHQSSNAALDLSSPAYSHNFYVDATPGTGDLYYGGVWHTWLVGGLGPGGQPTGPITTVATTSTTSGGTTTTTTTANTTTNSALYALDITNPGNFKEANASSLVLGEWTPASMTSTSVCAPSCTGHLGETYGTPQVRRLHNGNWGVIFGNGLNSPGYTAGIFVMIVDQTTGAKTFRYLDTGVGSSTSPNGIAYVTAADLDGDHITDYVYAGDQLGNVWRFDLTSSDKTLWAVNSTPVYTTASGQPITTRVTVSSVPVQAAPFKPKLMIGFGTGQKQPLTLTSGETYAPATQAMYGIWDWRMTAWNALTTAGNQFDSMTALPFKNGSTTVFVTPTVQTQTFTTTTIASTSTTTGGTYRSVASTAVICWLNTTLCPNDSSGNSTNTAVGWMDPLPGTNEQIIYNPIVAFGQFIVNTTIPGNSGAGCDTVVPSGFTMAVDMATGGASTEPFLPLPDGTFVAGTVGLSLNAVGTPSLVTTSTSKAYAVQQTVDGTPITTNVNVSGGVGARLNWIKVR